MSEITNDLPTIMSDLKDRFNLAIEAVFEAVKDFMMEEFGGEMLTEREVAILTVGISTALNAWDQSGALKATSARTG